MIIKIRFIFIISIFLLQFNTTSFVMGQVGINTSEPRGLLDISTFTDIEKYIIFSKDGNLGINTTDLKAKLNVKGTMLLSKSSSESNINIDNYILTSDTEGTGSWQYNAITQQNKVSSYNVELSIKNLFSPETRFTLTSINRNELNLSSSSSSYFALNPVPKGLYMIILNFELTNANSIVSFFFSTTSQTIPIGANESSCIDMTGKKISTSFLIDLDKAPESNFIYIGLSPRSQYMFKDWDKYTYWDKPWEALPSGENYLIKGTVDVIKLG